MQATKEGNGDDITLRRRLDFAWDRRVPVERHVRPGFVVVPNIFRQQAAKVPLTGDDDMVETVTPDRTNDALGIGVLPGRSVGRDDLTLR